jgi:hypothetical protein
MSPSQYNEARSSGDPFKVEPQPDRSFRIYGLAKDPFPVTRERTEMWLKWMETGGIKKLRQMLEASQD